MRSVLRVWLAAGLAVVAVPEAATAQASLHGFVQVNFDFRATGADCPAGMACDVMRSDQRLQLKFDLASPDGRAAAVARADLFHDGILDEVGIDLREAYLDLAARRLSARFGRQVVTWGLGDLVFINDVFPKDWVALLTGAPLEYLKLGSDALKVGFYPGSLGAEAVIVPVFSPDQAPGPDRLFFFDPLPALADRVTERPTAEFGHMQAAGRVYARVGRYEVAGYGSRGFFGMPGARLERARLPRVIYFYPRLNTYGGSVQGPLRAGVFSLEGGYYDSRDDRSGTDPSVENSQVRWLAAYQVQPREDLTLSFQYYAERVAHYRAYLDTLPLGLPARDRSRQVVSVRVTQFQRHQTLRIGMLLMVSPTDRDLYANPSIRYNVTDELWVELGSNIFWGESPHTFFGQFQKNSGVFLVARYGF